MSDAIDILIMLTPLYASAVWEGIQLSKFKNKMDSCVYCQKSKKIFIEEIEKI